MKSRKDIATQFLVSLIFSLVCVPAFGDADMCRSIFTFAPSSSASPARPARISYTDLIEFAADGKAYALGSEKAPGKEIQFGFESEYSLKELAPFTNHYGPTAESGISKEAWLKMSLESRMAWIDQKLKSIPFGVKDAVLTRLDSSPELAFLPSKLIRDDTGNIEIILTPVSEFRTWRRQVEWINRSFGLGSMQSMVSQPRESFFSHREGYRELALKEGLGYFNFINEMDVLERMASGAERFRADPTKKAMQPFLHPYLGPMVSFRHRKMVKTMTEIANGKNPTKEELEGIVRREQSFKYIGSTSYRPDIGGSDRVSQEIRDAHKSEELLIEKTARAVYLAQQGRFGFFDFGDVKAFDSKEVFDQMPGEVQNLLKSIFPVKAPRQVRDFENAMQAHETYRNFSYPLKDWRPYLKALDRLDLSRTVKAAQDSYLRELNGIGEALGSNAIDADKASTLAQGALAEFALASGLHKAFKDFEEGLPKKHRRRGEGTLETRRGFEFRLQMFRNKWAGNVTVVDDVVFKYKDEGQKTSGARRVLVVSSANLSEAQKNELTTDFLNVVSAHTISFPLKERASHMIVQFNGETYDLGYWPIQAFPQFRNKKYLLSKTTRLEPIVLLSRMEEVRFRKYIANIQKNFKATLGRFDLEGDPNTNGKLDDNRSCGGNNCTTFVATAPIGEDHASLARLLGGELTVPWIQQNPGWWGSWIVATASQDRVPLVAYWSTKSIEETLRQEFAPGASFQWDFNKK